MSFNMSKRKRSLVKLAELFHICLLLAVLTKFSACANVKTPYDKLLAPAAPPSADGGLAPIPFPAGGIYLWVTLCSVGGDMSSLGFPDFLGSPEVGTECSDNPMVVPTFNTSLTRANKAHEYCRTHYETQHPSDPDDATSTAAWNVDPADRARITAEHAAAGTTPQHRAVLVNPGSAATNVYQYGRNTGGIEEEPPWSLVGRADQRQVKRPDGTVLADHWFHFFDPDMDLQAPINDTLMGASHQTFWSAYTYRAASGGLGVKQFYGFDGNASINSTNHCNGWSDIGPALPATANFRGGVAQLTVSGVGVISTRRIGYPDGSIDLSDTVACNIGARRLLCVVY